MSMTITDRIWGKMEIHDPVIEEIIHSPEIQRLKGIAQAGISAYLEPERDTTRFEHSIGAMYLLQKFGCSREEQVAGLIHDFTHTAFSHVIDYVYVNVAQRYHEDEFVKKYKESSIYRIIKKHGLDPELFIDLERFTILEQPIPNLCVDRLDYFIRDYFISTKDKESIFLWINSLRVASGTLVFSDMDNGKRFGNAFLNEMEHTWFSPYGVYCYSLFAELLRKALQNNVITPSDFEMDDQALIEILRTKMEKEYSVFLSKAKKDVKVISKKSDNTYPYIGKFRYIDPFITEGEGLRRLSSLDTFFTEKVNSLKNIYTLPRFILPL